MKYFAETKHTFFFSGWLQQIAAHPDLGHYEAHRLRADQKQHPGCREIQAAAVSFNFSLFHSITAQSLMHCIKHYFVHHLLCYLVILDKSTTLQRTMDHHHNYFLSELKTKRAERKFVQCITVIKLQLNVIGLY